MQSQEWITISDLPTDLVDESTESPKNPIVTWLAEKGIKTWETILAEYKKQADLKKKEENDDTDEEDENDDKKDEKEEHDHVRKSKVISHRKVWLISICAYHSRW